MIAGEPAVDALVEELAGLLRIEPDLARRLTISRAKVELVDELVEPT